MSGESCILSLNNKRSVVLIPRNMAVYRSFKIIETTDEEDNTYYLYFYKQEFINGVHANQVKRHSFLHSAFTQGFTFSGSHPLTTKVFSRSAHYRTQRFNSLHKNLSSKYSPIESTYILVSFDSFIPKGQLSKLLKKQYYQYRRNGQLLNAFKILHIYKDFSPEDSFVKDMINHLDFQKYRDKYSQLENLYKIDSIQFEKKCFSHLHDSHSLSTLLGFLKKEERWMDELALRTALLAENKSASHEQAIRNLIREHTDSTEQSIFLRYLAEYRTTSNELCVEILDELLHHRRYEETIQLLLSREIVPEVRQYEQVTESFLQADSNIYPPHYHTLSARLLELFSSDKKSLERIALRCISSFFDKKNLNEIAEWLTPFNKAGVYLPIQQKLNKMKMYQEDPDQQFALGELYLYFDQTERSIDCFKWEMELHPDDPKPVQVLSKVYLKLGNKEEAAAYQQLLLQMKK
ncbi:tetratricopeptide repeat protein [Sediminibacillus massiliensis]|uniref:tetratricopeptide repeat protein n=1 Tax=Sediminibacillus massiliensis TaxID=1926277 RepID=UPI0009885A4F|nr:hypothetical protein [Sediminibacillus massiliensis]